MSEAEEAEISRINEEMRGFILKKCPLTLDPLSFVLRIHLCTEYYMNRFLSSTLGKCEQFLGQDAKRLDYHEKARVVGSLDVIPEAMIYFLLDLNKLRNALAHNLDKEITREDIDSLGKHLGAVDYREMCNVMKTDENILYSCLSSLCGRLAGYIMRIEGYRKEWKEQDGH